MTFPRLWAFLAVTLPTLAALIAGLSSVDLAYQLRAGEEILSSRAIPGVDTWTFTAAGAPWTDQQWGAQVVLAAVYRLGGWTALVLLRAGLVAIVFGCILEIGRRRGLGLRQSAWLALAAFVVSSAALALRPQLMGMALFAFVLLLVADRRAHPGRLWAIPLIVLVWANIHGSFFLGPVVLGLAWLEDLHDRLEKPHRPLLIGVVAAVVASVTPFGPAVWGYAVGLTMNPDVTRRITEWQPTSLRDPSGVLFFGSVLLIAILIARRGRPTPWPTLAWLGTFFVIGVFALRGAAWWPLGAVAGVLRLLGQRQGVENGRHERTEAPGTPLMRGLNASISVAIVIAGVALLPAWRPIDPGLRAPAGVITDAPPGITAALRDIARPGERVFNSQPWGSWLEFSFPDVLVAIDSRIEFFPAEIWDAYETVLNGGDGWVTQLDRWNPTVAVVMTRDGALVDRLSGVGWQTVYTDADGSIMVAPDRPTGRVTPASGAA